MESSTEMTGRTGQLAQTTKKVCNALSKWWAYVGFAIFLAVLNLILGILTLSYLRPKKEALLFGLICFAVIIALAHFASLCYLIQRAKEELSDPSYVDVAYAIGVVLLFVISGISLSIELPSRCFSGSNDHFKSVGQGCCNAITAMAVSSWLAVLIMVIASVMIFIAARKAIAFAQLPPPVFPTTAEAPIMRWLDRNDPFRLALSPHRGQQIV